MMKHSSNPIKYISAIILAILVEWMFHPAPTKGQGQIRPQVQKQNQAYTQKPWQDLPPKQFHRIMQTNPKAIILDTRMVEKYERNHIPGAQPAPYTEALKSLTDTLDKDHRLLVYCGHNERSTTVCRMLTKEMGFENVFRLKGGLRRWEKENLPLDTTAVRTGLK